MRSWRAEGPPPGRRGHASGGRRIAGPPAAASLAAASLAAALLAAALLSGCAGGDAAPEGEAAGATATADAAAAERAAAPASATTAGAARADSVLDAWIQAAGGMAAWDSVRSLRFTVTTVWFDATGEIERMRPRRVELRKTARGEESRIERPEAEGLYVQVFTGDTAWAALNGAALPPDDPAAAEAEYVGRDVFYWIGLPYKLRDPGVHHVARSLPEGGLEVAVTFGDQVGAHPGDRYFYYFLDDDPFPEEVHYIEQGRTEEDRNRTLWRGFEAAGPLTYVVTRTWFDGAGQPTKELRVDDVWVNPPLADSLFRP